MGRPASGSGSSEGTDHVAVLQDASGRKWGEIPVSSQAELKSIALKK
jgi:hypothetical protein